MQIVTDAKHALFDHITEINDRLRFPIPKLTADFAAAMKNKRTLKSLNESVNDVLAQAKIEANQYEEIIAANLKQYDEGTKGFDFLFPDLGELILLDGQHLKLLFESRIKDHKEAEEKRLAEERERIRLEEQQKAEQEAQRKAEADIHSAAERHKQEQKKVLLDATNEAQQRIQQEPVVDFNDDHISLPITEDKQFGSIAELIGYEDLGNLRYDEQGTHYELELVIRRKRIIPAAKKSA